MNRALCLSFCLAVGALAGRRGLCQTPRDGPSDSLKVRRALRAHHAEVRALQYSPNGRILASAGEDGKVKLWPARGGRLIRAFGVSTPCLALSPDGRWLATANFDPDLPPDSYNHPSAWRVRLWDARSGRLVRELAGHRGPVESVSWSPSGTLLASASSDGSVKLWAARTWRVVATLREPFSFREKGDHVDATRVLFAPRGAWLAIVTVDEYQGSPGSVTTHVALWDARARKRLRLLLEEQRCLNALVSFTPDGRRLVVATRNFPSSGNVYAWDLPRGPRGVMAVGEDASYAAALVPPGRWFAAGGKEWIAFLLDLRTATVVAHLPHPDTVTAMAASPDGKTLATGDYNGTIRFWPMPSPAPLPVRRSSVRGSARAGR